MGYKGRHRAPSNTGPRLRRIGTVSIAATAPVLMGALPANAATPNELLEVIAHCESGNRNVNNATGASTASGYWQIVNGTWRAYGGTQYAPRAIGASRAEQLVVAKRILAGQGLGAWEVVGNSCWKRNIGNAGNLPKNTRIVTEEVKLSTPKAAPKAAQKPKAVKATASPKSMARRVAESYVIKRGDTLAKIAKRNGTTWRALYNLNRGTVKNPNLIYAGNSLRLR